MPALRRSACCVFAAAMMLAGAIVPGRAAGAFAVGKCGAYGFSYDYPQADSARRAAVTQCEGDCTVIPVERTCAAFAVDGANACGAYGYATASKLGTAQNTAMRQCYDHGGRDCVIRAWICDAKG